MNRRGKGGGKIKHNARAWGRASGWVGWGMGRESLPVRVTAKKQVAAGDGLEERPVQGPLCAESQSQGWRALAAGEYLRKAQASGTKWRCSAS